MKADEEKHLENNAVQQDNENLTKQYNELMAEITEKEELMRKQLEDKEKSSTNIEEEIESKIKAQQETILQ